MEKVWDKVFSLKASSSRKLGFEYVSRKYTRTLEAFFKIFSKTEHLINEGRILFHLISSLLVFRTYFSCNNFLLISLLDCQV